MILDLTKGNEWQYFDKDGLLMPWYVKPVLDILQEMDLSNLNVWEYGLGASTLYYVRNSKRIDGVDSNEDWIKNVNDTLLDSKLISKSCLKLEHEKENYVNAIDTGVDYDIIVVDGIYRNECTIKAIQKSKKGTTIILDNWLQESVEIASQEVQDLVNQYPHEIYKQNGHPDWQTAIIHL